eukprot:2223924-Amphidinium_carterae.1
MKRLLTRHSRTEMLGDGQRLSLLPFYAEHRESGPFGKAHWKHSRTLESIASSRNYTGLRGVVIQRDAKHEEGSFSSFCVDRHDRNYGCYSDSLSRLCACNWIHDTCPDRGLDMK